MNITTIPDILNIINDESFVSDHFNKKSYTTLTNDFYKIIGYREAYPDLMPPKIKEVDVVKKTPASLPE